MVLQGCQVTRQGVEGGSQIEAVSKAEILRQEAKAGKGSEMCEKLVKGPGMFLCSALRGREDAWL